MGNTCKTIGANYMEEERAIEGSLSSSDLDVRLHERAVLGLAASGTSTLSCSDDMRICRFNWRDMGLTPQYFDGHEKAVNRVVVFGKFVWSVSRDLSLRQWCLETGSELQKIAQTHALNPSAVVAQNNRVYTGSRDYSVKGWDVETGKCITSYSCPRNIVTAIELDNDGNLLYQASEDLCVRVWDTRTSASSVPAVHMTDFVYFPLSIDKHPTNNTLATGCKGFDASGCQVKLWDLRSTSKPVVEFLGHTQDVTACKFSLDGTLLVSVSKDGCIFSWDTVHTTQGPAYCDRLSTGKILTSLTFVDVSSPQDHGAFAVGSFDGSVTLCSTQGRAMRLEHSSSSI